MNTWKKSEACQTPFSEMSPRIVKKCMTYRTVPENESWRTSLILKLLEAEEDRLEVQLNLDEFEEILDFACNS